MGSSAWNSPQHGPGSPPLRPAAFRLEHGLTGGFPWMNEFFDQVAEMYA
jgi:hypothetical protein